jgi:predicted metal-dependent enzyme (double-stranded beta helix superfamily)
MKTLFVLVAPFAVASLLAAQQPQQAPRIDPSAVPVDQEPNHKLVFANGYVRVLDVRFPPGFVSLMHTHAADNSAFTITPSTTGPEAEARIGRGGFSRGGYSHVARNTGTQEQRLIDVEFHKSDRPGSSAAPDAANHKLENEYDSVRVYRVKLAPGESLVTHTHQAGWMAVTIRGGSGPGTYAWHAGGSSNPLAVKAEDAPLEIVEFEPK